MSTIAQSGILILSDIFAMIKKTNVIGKYQAIYKSRLQVIYDRLAAVFRDNYFIAQTVHSKCVLL